MRVSSWHNIIQFKKNIYIYKRQKKEKKIKNKEEYKIVASIDVTRICNWTKQLV